MNPVSPVFPGKQLQETVFAKDQPEYLPLPAFRDIHGTVVTRWHMGWRERWKILCSGNVWLTIMTFNQKLQPVKIEAVEPKIENYLPE